MGKPTQKEIIDGQTIAINALSSRLIEVEVLLASVIDLVTDKNIIDKTELETMINSKVSILNTKLEVLKNKEAEEKIESYPYFGQVGEA